MSAIVRNIRDLPEAVPVLIGAAQELRSHRELRGHYLTKTSEGYYTNRNIKVWSCWFMLKALTSSGVIQNWNGQKQFLLSYLQMNENTFRSHLRAMESMKLVISKHSYGRKRVYNDGNIILASYRDAAEILDITYTGTTLVPYNPQVNNGKQIFQYILRAEEFRSEQEVQLNAFTYHVNKNLSLKNNLQVLLIKEGADKNRLGDPVYFNQRTLQLQMRLFKEGSDIFDYVMERRADINRSAKKIQSHHNYKSRQSVNYLKKRMFKLGLITVQKICVESKERTRFYVPGDDGKPRDGYKWFGRPSKTGGKDEGVTAWVLTDQITFNFKTPIKQKENATKAA